ncbi:hypothetical protein Rsub_01701 [Raphidocelis subcapitata]|uniref:PHD-type domain-containing protein n=1 Tax=Raphidocelis subcapitata TaxID=307507 RepID=A0A2V0NTA6_9CHLO|nr:hypothetical protein Rsub_01701 [Raphidocelis subcapitata]|eukprot:GBF88800.1 hypothetical protein Rsub_01701 [Raphidocelis subcapitata]
MDAAIVAAGAAALAWGPQPHAAVADAIKGAEAAQPSDQDDGSRATLRGDKAGSADASDDAHQRSRSPAAADAAAAAAAAPPAGACPAELQVAANGHAGLYVVARAAVRCLCVPCADARGAADPRGGALMTPTEFERHAGVAAAKKWRFTIKVTHCGEPAVCLGRWLELRGLDPRPSKRPSPGSRASPDSAGAGGHDQAPGGAGGEGQEPGGGRADAIAQLARTLSPRQLQRQQQEQQRRQQQQQQQQHAACPLAVEAPALASGTATPAAGGGRSPRESGDGGGGGGGDETVAEPPVAPRQQAPRARAPPPPMLEIAVPDGDGDGEGEGPPLDDSQWMQSPRKLRTPRSTRGGPNAGAAPGAAGAAAAAAAAAGGAEPLKDAAHGGDEGEEDEGIRVGPEFQADLPDWRPRPALHCVDPVARAVATAMLARELARTGPRGPSEEEAIAIAVEEKARADTLPPDATDDLWERREPALALERGQRQRRAPGWMAAEHYVSGAGGGGGGAAAARGGAGGGPDRGAGGSAGGGGDDDDGAASSDHGGAGSGGGGGGSARRGRKRVSSTHSGSSGPAPRGTALAHQQAAGGLQRARSGLSNASSGAVQLQQAIAAAVSQPGVPHMIEWRTDEGRRSMEAAVVLGGQVFVGHLTARGPLVNWIPQALLQQASAMQQAQAAAAPPTRVKEEAPAAVAVAGATAAAAAPVERANSTDQQHRRCALCSGGGGEGLGPFMPVQIQNGQLEWVHRDCALWSPEVSVDTAGRLVSLAAAVRRGMDTPCSHCGGRGATLACWGHRSCGCELHLPCARNAGCHLSEGGDARFGGRRAVACPQHDPSSAGFDAAEAKAEVAARDAALAEAGAAHGAAAAAAAAAAPGGEDVEAAAELLTGIKRGSLVGSADSSGANDQEAPAPPLRRRGSGSKRRRSGSVDGSGALGSDATAGGGSDDEGAAGGDEGEWAPGGRNGRSSLRASAAKRRAASASAPGAEAAARGDEEPALLGADPSAAARLLQRLQQLTGGHSDVGAGAGACGSLLQHLQPAALLGAAPPAAPPSAFAGAALFGGVPGLGLTEGFAPPAILGSAASGGGSGGGGGGRPGRCAVCVVQRKGKCGTDSAPKKCMRRQQALLEQEVVERKLRQQLAAQQDQLLMEQLRLAAQQEQHAAAAAAALAAAHAAQQPA